ncbi:unnamed protein product [Rotaria sp. Silwood1]|nr:unnamed protein product [Rotaria sp. Silwood1]
MSHALRIAVCSSTTNTQSTAICLPGIDHQTFSDINDLKNHVVTHSNSYSFIVLLMDLNDQNSRVHLEDLKRQHHVFAIFICIKPKCNALVHGNNVFPVIKELIAYKIKSSVVKFFEDTSRKLLGLNHIGPAFILKEKANVLKQQHFTNGKINACHILIIPLNTTDENLYDCQERLIHLCNNLFDDYELTVYTLYDYLPSNERIDFNENPYADIIYNYVKKLSPIRVYLIGNENYIPNSTSKYFFENEIDDGAVADEYDTTPTLVENEPINESITQNLPNVLDVRRPVTNLIIKQLHQIENDIKFPAALERANLTIQRREMVADIELQQRAEDCLESSFEFSTSFHMIRQAENGATNHSDDTSDSNINNRIQYESTQFFV